MSKLVKGNKLRFSLLLLIVALFAGWLNSNLIAEAINGCIETKNGVFSVNVKKQPKFTNTGTVNLPETSTITTCQEFNPAILDIGFEEGEAVETKTWDCSPTESQAITSEYDISYEFISTPAFTREPGSYSFTSKLTATLINASPSFPETIEAEGPSFSVTQVKIQDLIVNGTSAVGKTIYFSPSDEIEVKVQVVGGDPGDMLTVEAPEEASVTIEIMEGGE